MKEIIGVFAGGVAGNLLYAYTRGDPADYHWVRSFVFSALLAAVLVSLRKYRQWKSRHRDHGVR